MPSLPMVPTSAAEPLAMVFTSEPTPLSMK